MSSFIRHNCGKADIKIHLFNGGEEPFRNDVYGQEIIFERTIFKSGASTHTIKSKTGAIVYTKSE